MHDQPRGGRVERALTTDDEDTREERRVLREVVTYYGSATAQVTIQSLTICSVEFSDRDGIERAVRELTAGGLLHRMDDLVLPTRAAVKYYELEA